MSLRDRNRLATRRAIQTAALLLFRERGFVSVTIEEIAEEAGVSQSTLYRSFGVKEELVLWDEQDAAIASALGRHLGKKSPLDALEASFKEAYTGLTPEAARLLRERAALIDETPELLDFQVARLDKERRELIAALASRYRRRQDDLELEMVARVAFAALLAAFERWQAAPRSSLPKLLEKSFAALRSVFSATS